MLDRVNASKNFGVSEFRPDEVAELKKNAKCALRKKLRTLREALPAAAAAARSERIVERLTAHPRVQAASGVALFWPMLDRREVDLRSLDEQLRARGCRLFYPFMERDSAGDITTGFRRVDNCDQLVSQGHRFVEPLPSAPIAARGEIDVVIVPAVGATTDGHRLGYGAGFYDATLGDHCPPAFSIVVVYAFQLMLELPIEAHDLACDTVVSDDK